MLGFKFFVPDQLVLDCMEKGFSNGIVPAVTFSAHTLDAAMLF